MTRFLLPLLLYLLPLGATHAVEVDVYTGEVEVAGQSASERRDALPEALRHVLQKMTGLRSFDGYPQVEPALAVAPSILLSFHYRSAEALLPDGTTADVLNLVARFVPDEVDQMVRRLQLPLWQANRKPTEVWVVVDNGMTRSIMPVEFSYLRDAMDAVAQRRGLPLTWPAPDEEGQYPVDMQLLWGGYTEDLASPRGDGVLIIAARREGVEWHVRSNLGYEKQNWAWRMRDIDLEAALLAAVELAVDQLASVDAIAASDLGTWQYELTVQGFRHAEDYERCLGYLQSVPVVESVAVTSASPGAVTFRLQLNALPRYLEDAVSSGRVLEMDEESQSYRLAGAASRGN